jgi:putative ABC transport system ATP-binding protein
MYELFRFFGITVGWLAIVIQFLSKMIQTEKLTKIFRTEEVETIALNEVDIHIKEGEFVSVMGPSGCGKSTLLNILGLLDHPTGGSYRIKGREVAKLKEKDRSRIIRENIGFVFQSFILIDELNVFDNIRLPLNYHKLSTREKKERVRRVMQRMKIGHRAMHYPQQLSGGQQQRVAIARAVVANPRIILADEPTGNLDSKNGIEVMNLLSDLNRAGTTIVMVTHSERDAGFAHRTINLFDGQIVKEGGKDSVSGLTNTHCHEYAG